MSVQQPQPGVRLDPARKAAADDVLAAIVADMGAPALDDYRRVYDTLRLPWPGDDRVRRLYPVADTALSR
ncbi:MAG: hypothetical protein ACRDT0_08135 [Pseudonocardiaceae bacterium]